MSDTFFLAGHEAKFQAGTAACVVREQITHLFNPASRIDTCHQLVGRRAGNQPFQVHPWILQSSHLRSPDQTQALEHKQTRQQDQLKRVRQQHLLVIQSRKRSKKKPSKICLRARQLLPVHHVQLNPPNHQRPTPPLMWRLRY